jgi:hypothetical protein
MNPAPIASANRLIRISSNHGSGCEHCAHRSLVSNQNDGRGKG